MTVKTREEYMASLRSMRPNIYKFGELIEDVTVHPATKRTVESHARAFDGAAGENASIFTAVSHLTGEKIMRFNGLMESLEDIMANARLKREMYRLTGTCTGGLCVGWNAMNVLWAVTHDMDRDLGTNYRDRLREWILKAEKECLVAAGALTDAKGDRGRRPSQQSDLDTNLHIVEKREDGIVIRGGKVMICGVAASNEIFLLPGGAYREEDKDYALACVVPRDIEGLTIVETRRPSDSREYEEGFDVPDTGITQAYLLFDDVFVPNERVFMAGEYAYSGKVIQYFTSNYRACIGGCVTGQGDVMIGAGMLMARSNGLEAKKFTSKFVDMAVNNETTYGVGIGAMALGKAHPSGVWISDDLMAHTNKVLVASLPYETKRICQDIGGGIVETGCLPSYEDLNNPNYGEYVQRMVKAGPVSAETRARAARLSEWLTIGAGVPGCMHGGGSPDGAKLVVKSRSDFEKYAEYAKRIAGITEDVKDPVPAK
jgi:4-hydroxybutyryl-CoA dehydratase/vinylacetyl-CoA-Delta-isomerase